MTTAAPQIPTKTDKDRINKLIDATIPPIPFADRSAGLMHMLRYIEYMGSYGLQLEQIARGYGGNQAVAIAEESKALDAACLAICWIYGDQHDLSVRKASTTQGDTQACANIFQAAQQYSEISDWMTVCFQNHLHSELVSENHLKFEYFSMEAKQFEVAE